MAVVYRCDACGKLVETDKDIVKMKFSIFSMKEGVAYNLPDWTGSKIVCTKCKNKILDFENNIEGNIQNGKSERNT